MSLYPKYIIEDDFLIMGKVNFHKQLATNKDNVKGGGWFKYNNETNTFVFSESSHDFGRASLEDVKKCIEDNKVFTDKMQIREISKKHKFKYDTQSELIDISIIEK